MKTFKWFFEEADQDKTFSWRKGLTCISGFVFLIACLAYIFGIAKQLPNEYTMVVSGVFAFYFLKKSLSNIIKKKDD